MPKTEPGYGFFVSFFARYLILFQGNSILKAVSIIFGRILKIIAREKDHAYGSYGKFEDFAGRLAPASEVAGGHTIPF
jgi:hypothetical protein